MASRSHPQSHFQAVHKFLLPWWPDWHQRWCWVQCGWGEVQKPYASKLKVGKITKVNGNLYKTVLLNGSETEYNQRFERTERAMICWMRGGSTERLPTSDELRAKLSVTHPSVLMCRYRLCWYRHITRKDDLNFKFRPLKSSALKKPKWQHPPSPEHTDTCSHSHTETRLSIVHGDLEEVHLFKELTQDPDASRAA